MLKAITKVRKEGVNIHEVYSPFPVHGIEKALAIDEVDIRLFGKPESFVNRRMGVILSTGKNIDEAKLKAQEAKLLLSIKPK